MALNITPSSLNGNPRITFSGLNTGFDTNAVVDARVSVDQQQIKAIQAQERLQTSRQDAYNKVGAALQALQAVAEGLKSNASILPASATTTDSSVLTAAAGLGAAQGSYTIVVNAVAQAQVNYSSSFSSATQAGLLTPGALNIQSGSNKPIAFNISEQTTLQSLADQINSTDPSAVASIINDGSGYRLSVASSSTGAANTLTFTDDGTGLDLEDNRQQDGQDAKITINNALTAISATNSISDAISGVTLQAVAPSTMAQILTVGVDSSELSAGVQDLVNDYNRVITAVTQASPFEGNYDPTSLIGDATLRNLQGELQDVIGAVSVTASGTFRALSQLGLSTQSDGLLRIDENQLQAAIAKDPQSGAALLSSSADGSVSGIAGQIADIARSFGAPVTGILSQMSRGIAEQNNASDNIISDMQNAVNTYKGTLQQQFVALEKLMTQFKAQNELVSAFAYQVAGQSNGRDSAAPTAQDVINKTITKTSQSADPG